MYVKGMVQLFGTTYRIVRLKMGYYQVVRIHDEVVAGWFSCDQSLVVTPGAVDTPLMQQLASLAVQRGKTSWMGPRVVR
jgi:hypothetical protein